MEGRQHGGGSGAMAEAMGTDAGVDQQGARWVAGLGAAQSRSS
jgi:hypothetical protein